MTPRRPLGPRLKLALAYAIVVVVTDVLVSALLCGIAHVTSLREALFFIGVLHINMTIGTAFAWAIQTIRKADT